MKYGLKGIFGILNITEDSFSDGGKFSSFDTAIDRAEKIFKYGGDYIDIGAVSSNPNSKRVNSQTEIEKIDWVRNHFSNKTDKLSVDTFNPNTQRYYAERNIGWINDIRGFENPEIYDCLAQSDSKLIVMHAVQEMGKADIRDVNSNEIQDRIMNFFSNRLSVLYSAGIAGERIIIDPGMGYFLGSDPECSIRAMKMFPLLSEFGHDVMISLSRKSFVRKITEAEDMRQIFSASYCAEIVALLEGFRYIRTHEVESVAIARKFLDAYEPGKIN